MTIEITQEAFLKLKYFITECPDEISGFGKVRKIETSEQVLIDNGNDEEEDEDFEPTDTERRHFFNFGFWPGRKKQEPQYRTEKKVKLEIYDIEVLPQVVTSSHASIKQEDLAKFLVEKMKKKESTVDYKVWWHSHATFDVFFSITDIQTIEESDGFPYLISIVGNHKGEFKTRLDVFKPVPATMEFELIVQASENKEIKQWCKREIAKKVKRVPLTNLVLADDDAPFSRAGSLDEFLPVPDAPGVMKKRSRFTKEELSRADQLSDREKELIL